MPERRQRLIVLAAALGVVLLMAVRKTADWDVWFHLAIGRAALAHGPALDHDLFSYATAGTVPWRYKDLLAAILLYAGFSRLGFVWFALVEGATVAAMGAGLWLCLPPPRRSPVAWLLALAVLAAAIAPRVCPRPLLFSLAGFVLMLGLVERARRAAEDERPAALGRAFAPLIVLQWVWAALHREAMVGLALLVGFALYLTLTRLVAAVPPLGRLAALRASTRAVWAGWLTAAAALGATLANPSGVSLLSSSVDLAGSHLYRYLIAEWETLGPAALAREFPLTVALALAAGGGLLVRLVLAWRRVEARPPVDLWHLGCWLLFASLGLTTIRWLPEVASTSAAVGLLLLVDLGARLAARPRPRGLALLAAVAALALVGATHPQPLGLGERRDRFPSGALAFAAAHGLHQRVVNAYPFGGYVMWKGWPRFQVLVDGRADTVYRAAFIRDALLAERDPRRFAAMRAVDHADWVLALNKSMDESHRFLAADPKWSLVYWSEAALVYVRRDAYPALEPLRFRLLPRLLFRTSAEVAPLFASLRGHPAELDEMERELLRLTAASPDGRRANSMLLLFYDRAGPAYRERRARVLQHLVELGGPRP